MANRGKLWQIADVIRSKIVVEIGVFYYCRFLSPKTELEIALRIQPDILNKNCLSNCAPAWGMISSS